MAQAPNHRQSIVELLATLRPEADPTADALGVDAGLGPVTPMSRAGMTPAAVQTGELRSYEPSPGENAAHGIRSSVAKQLAERFAPPVQAILDYGPEPAKQFIAQADRAGEHLGKFAADPTLENFGGAALHTGLAVAPINPAAGAAGLVAAGGGLIEAGRRTFAPDILPSSDAQGQPKKAPPPQVMSGRKWEDLLSLAGGDEQIARGWAAMGPKALGDALKSFQENSPASIKARGEAEAAAQAAKDKQEADAAAVKRAGMAYSSAMAKDTEFRDTPVGKYVDAMGGYDPYAAGGVAGMLARAAGTRNPVAIIGAGAAGGLGAVNAPTIYNAKATPVLNPKREAMLAYDQELPLDHPEKGHRAAIVQQNPEAYPTRNPVREAATRDLDVTDPKNLLRMGWGALEGGLTALPGAHAVETGPRVVDYLAQRAARVPGQAFRNFTEAFKRGEPEPPPTVPYSYAADTPFAQSVLDRAYRQGGSADRFKVRDDVLAAAEGNGRRLNPADVERRVTNATRSIEGTGLDLSDPAQRTQAIQQSTGRALKRGRGTIPTLGVAGATAIPGLDFVDPDPASNIVRMLASRPRE